MRILIVAMALVFGLRSLTGLKSFASNKHIAFSGGLFGALAGFTNFSIHAGGPPFTMYLMPKQLSPLLFAGTAGIFFAVVNVVNVVNVVKLVPYYAVGQLAYKNLLYSLVLMPLAPLGVKLGYYLVRRSTPTFYYSVVSSCLILVGAKLVWYGVSGFSAVA